MSSIIKNEFIDACECHAQQWKEREWGYYETLMCCKEVDRKTDKTVKIAYEALRAETEITDTLEEVLAVQKAKLCCLPKGHGGKCTCNVHTTIFNNKTISCKMEWIYSTPGNNDFVFKNRSHRLFPIRLSDTMEKEIRNKDKKLKCAIPLKDASTPEFLVSAYIDYLTLLLNVKGIDKYLNKECAHYKMMLPVITAHKTHMAQYYKKHNKHIFETEGYSVCPVLGNIIESSHLLEGRDHPDGIQLGHVQPRSCHEYTIRGGNVLLMSRDGNRIIGDYNFTDDVWIEKLRTILEFHSLES